MQVNRIKKLGILGGTFDPIHYGHLAIAEAVRHELNLEKIIFVPTGNPPHKREKSISESNVRYIMSVMATITNPFFEVSRIEMDAKGYSYTVDTLKAFKMKYGTECQLYFITGADALLEILTWKEPGELLSLCTYVVATRPGFDYHAMNQELEAIRGRYKTRVLTVEVPSLDISSTDIRKRVKNNKPLKYLLPELVEDYIRKNGLYI